MESNPILQHFKNEQLDEDPKSWQANSFQNGTLIASEEQPDATQDPTNEPNFSVANLTASDLIDDYKLAKEKKKYFCLVKKGELC